MLPADSRFLLPGFTLPEEDAGPGQSTFIAQPVAFTLDQSGAAALTQSGDAASPMAQMHSEPSGVVGTTDGLIACKNGAEFGRRTLRLKLVPMDGRLCGRVVAEDTRPGMLTAYLPYVITLERF